MRDLPPPPAPDGIRRIWVVRHGQVEENLHRPHERMTVRAYNDLLDRSDRSPLTLEGRRQIEALTAFFRGRPIPAVHSSPLPRALETAAILAEGIGVPVVPVAGLRELVPAPLRRSKHRGARPAPGYPLRILFLRSMICQFWPFTRRAETVWQARRRVYGAWQQVVAWTSEHPGTERLITAHKGTLLLLVSVVRRDRRWRVVRRSSANGGITEIVGT